MVGPSRTNRISQESERPTEPDSVHANAVATADILQCLEAMAGGNYIREPAGRDLVSSALRKLVVILRENAMKELNNTVSLSIQVNETAIFSAQMLSDLKEVNQNAHGIAAAAEEMVTSVREIDRYGRNISQQSEETKSETADGVQAVRQATHTMEEITRAACQTVKRINRFAESTKRISAIADAIKTIAGQTNLLSLNAMIEAARVGDAGKGFAVVANEVKGLSKQTTEATNGIEDIVKQLQQEMQELLTSMEETSTAINRGQEAISAAGIGMERIQTKIAEVTENTHQIAEVISQQAQASDGVARGITAIAGHTAQGVQGIEKIVDAMAAAEKLISAHVACLAGLEVPDKVVKLAQSDHVIWKKRLANMMVGREGLNPDELADHHQCRLGKWYDSVNDPRYTAHPVFPALVEPHTLVHQHGKQAARCFNQGDIQGALKEIEQVEAASRDVLRLLTELADGQMASALLHLNFRVDGG